LQTEINGTEYNNVVVADAVELRGDDGQSFGTPVAVNITPPILANYPLGAASIASEVGTVGDYSEIALGYGAGNPAGDGQIGGLPISYQTDTISTTLPIRVNPVPPQLYSGNYGYAASAAASLPIDQVAYFTKTEPVPTDPDNSLHVTDVGHLYCANGQTGDIIWRFPSTSPVTIDDLDTAPTVLFALSGAGWSALDSTNSATSFNSEPYYVVPATSGAATATATWAVPPTFVTGRYYVYAYVPAQGNGETYVESAHYAVNTNGGTPVVYNAYVNQQEGGNWEQLQGVDAATGASTDTFTLSNTATVTLTNDAGTTNGDVCANAVEFVPVDTMGTSDSTPAVVRNMKVFDSAAPNGYISRAVVIAADNSGRIFCVDASGNGDGNDILLDATGAQVEINAAGQATNLITGNPAVLPLQPTAYGTTTQYWVWQPNASVPAGEIINEHAPAVGAVTVTGAWAGHAGITNAYLGDDYTDPAVARTPAPTDYVTYSPAITAAQVGLSEVFVWDPGNIAGETHVTDAEYTIVDNTGTKFTCNPVDQTAGTGGWVELISGSQSLFNLGLVPNNPPAAAFATTPNTIVLDNTTGTTVTGQVVVADAVKILFNGGANPNSNLIPPLAFQTCSPTVHVVPDTTATFAPYTVTYAGTPIKYDYYDAKIYIGNSNGVLYALDGAGNADGADAFQRDLSQDPLTPSPSVDWWFNVGVTAVDGFGEILDQTSDISEAIAGTPAYYHKPGAATTTDQILFTTYSPNGGNEGNLYSVNAMGPIGYFGTDVAPVNVPDYRQAAGTSNYNLTPIPYFSFPDAYGTPHLPNTTVASPIPLGSHLYTSLLPTVNGFVPAAHPLGDSPASPTVFALGTNTVLDPINHQGITAGTAETLPDEVYIEADDPTADGSSATFGRIWGVNLATGTTDNGVSTAYNSFIYPSVTNGANPPVSLNIFDPNIIGTQDSVDITKYYDNPVNNDDSSGNPTANSIFNTPQFGPFEVGPITTNDSSLNYFEASSPAVGIVHTIPSTAIGTLTDTLVGGGTAPLIYPAEYGANGPYDIDVPMLYVGDAYGILHSINLAGSDNNSRFIQDSLLDGSPIISTPVLLANGNEGPTPNLSSETGNNVGGVLFVNTTSGSLWESEAFPFIENGIDVSGTTNAATLARNVDFEFTGPGGVSSVAAASFNIDNFVFNPTAGTPTFPTPPGVPAGSVDTSEWIYASGDDGFTYGLTPNNSSEGNGGTAGFNPGIDISPINSVQNSTVPQNRNFATQVLTANPLLSTVLGGLGLMSSAGLNYVASNGPPNNPAFDWGQTAYIAIYGLDDPTAGTSGPSATPTYPRAISVSFTIQPVGTYATPKTITKTINLQNVSVYPNATIGSAILINPATWPVPGSGYVPTTSANGTDPAVGPYVAIYAFQMGNGSGGDAQTPGSKIQITNIREQAEYYDTNGALVVRQLSATSSQRIIRESNGAGGYQDVETQPMDQGTFSILNPIAIRTAGVGMDGYPWYDLFQTTNSIDGGTPASTELGPFSGAPNTGNATTNFQVQQMALTNGNSVPQTPITGGNTTTSSGTPINPNDPTGAQIPTVATDPIIVAVGLGAIGDGTDGTSATIGSGGLDPSSSAYGVGPYENPAAPAVPVPPATAPTPTAGDYGTSSLDIADRSAVGSIGESLNALRITKSELGWQDNSGNGGAMSVINPLPWDSLPTTVPVGRTLADANSSADYPNISSANSSVELLPRSTADPAAHGVVSLGSDTVVTSSKGTLASASVTAPITSRRIYPNAAMVRVNIPRYQPANLESYTPNTGSYILQNGSTRFNVPNSQNVGQGYIATYRVYIDSLGTGIFKPTDAQRTVQVWVTVPPDLRNHIAEQTVDVGSVPAGFGIDLASDSGNAIDNSQWSPFAPGGGSIAPSNALNSFFKPITLMNDGNVNFVNLHLNQYNNIHNGATSVVLPNAFESYTTSGLTAIPSFDTDGTGAAAPGPLTGTLDEPIVRSSLDYFPNLSGTSPTVVPGINIYQEKPYIYATPGNTPPGPVAAKPRVGDSNGAVVTVPAIPHGNSGNGTTNVSSLPYNGRPVVSLAVPLGTPAGSYSSTIYAFEGDDMYTTNVNGTSSFAAEGPTYANQILTSQGWMSPSISNGQTTAPDFLDVIPGPQGYGAVQTLSNPGAVLTVNVVEGRITDGPPLPVTTYTGATPNVYNATLPYTDAASSAPNSNDLQPWAFYDPSGNGLPTFGLLWTSQRNQQAGTVALAATPYSLYSSGLVATNDSVTGNPINLNQPSSLLPTSAGWWTPSTQLTELPQPAATAPNAVQQSYDASTYGTLASNVIGDPINALWVTSVKSPSGGTSYSVYSAPVTYANNQPQLPAISGLTPLFTTSQPVLNPRASYYYTPGAGGADVLTGFTPTGMTGVFPLIVYTSYVGGRSALMYWPSTTAAYTAGGTPNSNTIIGPAPVPLPLGITSASTPTIVARPVINVAGTPTSQIDIVFSGIAGSSGSADICTARYSVIPNTINTTTATLTALPTLSTAAIPASAPAADTLLPTLTGPTIACVNEPLVEQTGTQTWYSRDIGWDRDPAAFQLALQTNPVLVSGNSYSQFVLVAANNAANGPTTAAPAGNGTYTAPLYDRASGQWVFTINFNNLVTAEAANPTLQAYYEQIYTWWTGTSWVAISAGQPTPNPNITVYANPNTGAVTFSAPVPAGSTISNVGGTPFSFQTLNVDINPMAMRNTFESQSNTAPIAFIDNQFKLPAEPGQNLSPVMTSRYWYIYRKQTANPGNASASSSVLYYNTRRLTLVLTLPGTSTVEPVELTNNNGLYSITTPFSVTDSVGNNITNAVDVDWARGRVYFPETYNVGGTTYQSEGQTFTVSYEYAETVTVTNPVTNTVSSVLVTSPAVAVKGVVTWQDEPLVNSPTQTSVIGEHVLPDNAPASETDPSAFLDPLAGAPGASAGTLASDPSTASSSNLTGEPYSHKVWVFWTSNRNASSTSGPLSPASGSDIYWETIDPRFEVINP
jgi:hypothetical protein